MIKFRGNKLNTQRQKFPAIRTKAHENNDKSDNDKMIIWSNEKEYININE